MRLWPVLLLGVLGCTDDGPSADPYRCVAAGGEGCFELPTDVVSAADSYGVTVLPVLDCGPYEVATSGGALSLAGHVVNPQQMAVPGVRIEAFSDMTLTSRLFDVTSDGDGAWSANTTVSNLAFIRTTADGQLPLHTMYRRIDINVTTHDMFDVQTATKPQVASVFEVVGDRYLPGKSQLTAVAYDCAGNKLVNVIANIAPASGKNGSRLFEPNVRTYYGVDGDDPVLARRTELAQTSTSGLIGIANISPGMHYVQLWAYPDAAALTRGSVALKLLAEHELFIADVEAFYSMPLYGRL